MLQVLLFAQILVSIILVGAILLQSQGSGLGSTWGGGGETYHTKRGLEKVLFYVTIIGVGVFVILSVASVALA